MFYLMSILVDTLQYITTGSDHNKCRPFSEIELWTINKISEFI